MMKRWISVLLILCSLNLDIFAQNPSTTNGAPDSSSKPILSSADPATDEAAFAKVRARLDSIRQYRPTVGLVLAGGGARGLAHLGVIKYMEELGIPIDVVTGTSMGGLVGGLYALGYKHDQLDSLVRAIEWPTMMSDNIPNKYISYTLRKYRDKFVVRIPHHYDEDDVVDKIKNQQIVEKMAEETESNTADMLSETISRMGVGLPDGYLYGLNVRNMLSSVSVGYQDSISFADLPIPYVCVATDLYAMTPKYWTSGSITDALRSTMAIPFYFRAVRKEGEVLLDGGMRNNFPVDVAKALGADIIIGSDMSIHRELNELNSPVDFLMQTITLLASSTNGPAQEILANDRNVGVHHELKGYSMLSFDEASVNDIIDQGYRNARENQAMFQAIAAEVAGRPDPGVARHRPAVNLALRKVRVREIRFDGIGEHERSRIQYMDDVPADGLYDRAIIERLLNDIYGTNAFEAVAYHLEGTEEPYTLVFECQKGQTNDFAVGVRADTDETVAVALRYGIGTRRLTGLRFQADLKLGTNPSFSVDWGTKSRVGLPSYGIIFRGRLLNTTAGYVGEENRRKLTMATDVYLEDTRIHSGSMRLGLSAEMDPYSHHLSPVEFQNRWNWKDHWLSAFANFKYDTFNDGYFPTRGVRIGLKGRYVFKGYSSDLDPDTPRWNEEWATTTEGGKVPRYITTMGSLEAALSIGEHFTVLPKLYAGWYRPFGVNLRDVSPYPYVNIRHVVTVGGFIPDRYTENQIPFFLWSNGYRETFGVSTLGQLDLRYGFGRKHYITIRGGAFSDIYSLDTLSAEDMIWGVGAEYALKTLVGPLKVAAQWGPGFGASVYASIGFDF